MSTTSAPDSALAPLNSPQYARLVEAARYALLRRLAPTLRHDLAGNLQPISMLAAILERRLLMSNPDLDVLAKNAGTIGTLSREAVSACMNLINWLAPQGPLSLPINSGVAGVLEMLATDFSFRGINLQNDCGAAQGQVLSSALHSVFVAALLALSDTAQGQTRLTVGVGAQTSSRSGLTLNLQLSAIDGQLPPALKPAYRKLDWDDVQALATAEGVEFSRSQGTVLLYFGE